MSHVKRMQEAYDLNACMNSEVRFRWVVARPSVACEPARRDGPLPRWSRWLRLCVRSRWEEAVPVALGMATEQGRMKFTRPLFR